MFGHWMEIVSGTAPRTAAWTLLLLLAVALTPPAAAVAAVDGPEDATATSATAGGPDDSGEEAGESESNAAGAQTADGNFGGFDLRGQLRLAYRNTDVDGAIAKYKEDYDLDEGVRLLDTRLVMVPAADGDDWADQIVLEADGMGGDPYRTWGITMKKAGTYQFRFRNRRVAYFWDVTGEVHGWELTRKHQDAELTVNLSSDLELYGQFQRFRQERLRFTTRDIERAEFEFEEPLDQSGTTYTVGARWRLGRSQVFLEQSWRQFQDNGGFTGPATPLGDEPTRIDFLEQKEVRAMEAPITRGGIVSSSENGKWRFSADFLYSDQELGFDFNRLWEGVNSGEEPFAQTINAFGDIERTVLHANGKLLFLATDDVRTFIQYRRRGYDQDLADQTFAQTDLFPLTGEFAADAQFTMTDYQVTVDQYLAGLEVAPSRAVSLFGHVGYSDRFQEFHRTIEDRSVTERSNTESLTFKVGTRLRPSSIFDAQASYEYGDVDDPFTRVSPTTANTIKVKARVRPGGGWTVSGNYKRRDLENDVSGADLLFQSFGGDVAYHAGPERWLVAGYARNESNSEVPITFIFPAFGNVFEDTAIYDVDSNVVHGAFNLKVSDGMPLVVLGRGSWVDSTSLLPDVTFLVRSRNHDISRTDLAAGLRYLFESGFFLDVEARFIDYEEDTELASDVDDFDATIYTIGLGVRF